MPLYLGGGLAALAVIGVILAIVALASRNDEVKPTATPVASAVPPGATPTAPLATQTPLPNTTPSPDPNATVSPDPNATASPAPSATASPEATPSATTDPNTTGSTFPDWSGTDGWTVIIESSKTQSGADTVATKAESESLSGVGILQSSNYSSLNGGYYVVFVGEYTSKSDAEAALPDAKSKFSGAYVRKVAN